MSLVHLIQTIGEAIESRYEYVSWGGCGVVALHLGRWLERIGVRGEVVIMSRKEIDSKDVRRFKQENGHTSFKQMKEEFGFDYNHIVIKFKERGRTFFADSLGVYCSFDHAVSAFAGDATRYPVYGLSLDDLELQVKNRKLWNPRFKRRQILGIRRTIAKHFREYKRETQVLMRVG